MHADSVFEVEYPNFALGCGPLNVAINSVYSHKFFDG